MCDISRLEMTYMATRQKLIQLEQNSCCTLKDLCTSFTSVFPSNFFLPVLLVLVYCSLESNQISHTEAESLLANQKVSGLASI